MADKKKKLKPDDIYTHNLPLYQLYANCIGGGRRLLKPPQGTLHPITGTALPNGSYLVRLAGEVLDKDGSDVWQRRRNAAAHVPISSEVIDTHVDSLARQGVDRTAVAELLPDVVGRTDQERSRTATWVNTAFSLGLSQGWLGALVDAPVVEAGEFPSQWHLERAGLRPYAQILLPRRFWKLERDRDGTVTYALVRESPTRWGEWRPDEYRALSEDGDVIDGPRPIPLGRIPIEIFTAADPDFDDELSPPGESIIRAVSLLDLQILQHLSWIDDLVTKSGFCLLHAQGDPPIAVENDPEEDIIAGPGFVWYYPGQADWKAPPPDLIKVLWEHVRNLRQEAYRTGGIYQRSQDMAEASSGIAIKQERAPIDNRVVRWAQNLQDWETRVWRLVAQMAGLDPSGVEVTYPEDFSTLPVNADLEQGQRIATIYGGYGAAPDVAKAWIDAKMRRAAARDAGHVPTVRAALSEAEAGKPLAETEAVDPKTALNGAQVVSLLEIATAVSEGRLPKESAVEMITSAFPMDRAAAKRIVDPIKPTLAGGGAPGQVGGES